jgi:hypothetical protein
MDQLKLATVKTPALRINIALHSSHNDPMRSFQSDDMVKLRIFNEQGM